jgi:putative oxidoreductase
VARAPRRAHRRRLVFLETGWLKLECAAAHDPELPRLGHPAPEVMTPLASGIEFVCGALLLAGLLTRFAAVPLNGRHGGRHLSRQARRHRFARDLHRLREVSYFLMFAWLAIAGPGPVSLDHFFLKASGRDPGAHGA